MARLQRGERVGPWMISPEFLGSAEFAVATVSFLALVGLAGPLLAICYGHFAAGNLELGCTYALLGVAVTGVSGSKFATSLRRGRSRFTGSGRAGTITE